MGHRISRIVLALGMLSSLTLAAFLSPVWSANQSTDYTGVPPYANAGVVTPNILLLMDNSLSMQARANCDPSACVPQPDGLVNTTNEQYDQFGITTSYTGYFNSLGCYTYDTSNQRFKQATSKTLVQDTCSDTQWDGNLLNWITFRRIDALKNAMIGGECAASRSSSDGSCPPSGTPALVTIQSHRGPGLGYDKLLELMCAEQVVGRVPAAYRYRIGASCISSPPVPLTGLFIKLRGDGAGSYTGWFCVDDDTAPASLGGSSCNAGSVYVPSSYYQPPYVIDYDYPDYTYTYCDTVIEGICTHYTSVFVPGGHVHYEFGGGLVDNSYWSVQEGVDATAAGFNIRVASDTEPTGVIQQIGSKARFGLMIFQPDNSNGGKVLVGIGARQAFDFRYGNVLTTGTNTAAVISAIEWVYAKTPTPLAESLYEAARYIAQINSSFNPSTYTYPIAFTGGNSNGVGLGGTGAGSIGSGEITALGSSENCPSGYIADACGRDPYFFGQNFTPAWASPSAVVPCCQTFVMILTDGVPTLDAQIPAALQNYAVSVYGTPCTGPDDPTIHDPANGICNSNPNTPASTLLKEHKTDYPQASHYLDDVALWAHTTDLRQSTIPGIGESGHDLPGMQNITVYTFYAFGNISGREILMQTAKQGGFIDSDGDNLPTLPSEWDKINNADGSVGSTVPGCNADCIPDNYFESSNAAEIKARLFAAISHILEVSSSGTAVSVQASSSTGEGTSVQTFFYSKLTEGLRQLSWLGYLQDFFVDKFGNLREDTNRDGKLVLTQDYVIKLRFDPTTNPPSTVADRYRDTAGTGVGDTFVDTVPLTALTPIWEAGQKLALIDPGDSCEGSSIWPKSANLASSGTSCRRILTWVDVNNDGIVDPSERIEFSATTGLATLCPYLGGVNVLTCVSGGAGGAGQTEATDIINFIRGCDPSTCPAQTSLRDRKRSVTDDTGTSVTRVWKLGDIMGSTPVTVGSPRERYDVLYGDVNYARFYQRYKDRRQVVYSGANDGMLHAFNSGFLALGDVTSTTELEQLRLTTTPKRPASTADCAGLPCDGSVATYAFRSDAPKLGVELWAFVPQDLLPQLRWLTDSNYSHTYYVDLKPKVTDARIFPDDADHPGGWGTVLIGGFRFGGSCSNCIQGKGGPRTVTADFNANGATTDPGDTRVFLSSYFVLDITNPEKDPVLLWTFRDQDMGLTTAAPAIIRVNPSTDLPTSSTNEKWYVVFGTGPTHYDGSSGQTAQIFLVDLELGPSYSSLNATSGTVRGKACSIASPCLAAATGGTSPVQVFSTGQGGAFMADATTLDADLDFRVDVVYMGSVICRGGLASPCNGANPVWRGTLWRLTTNHGSTDLTTWGVTGAPSKLMSTFGCADGMTCSTKVGPIVAAPALSIDDKNNFWVFFGTGRLISALDKTNSDTQHFFGVIDCFISNQCATQRESHDLFNVSNISICTDPDPTKCDPTQPVSTDGGVTFTQSFDNLVMDVQSKDGWFTTLPNPRERSLTTAVLLGGTLIFTTLSPGDSPCDFSGDAFLYGLFYTTGTGYTASALGDSPGVGGNLVANRSISLGQGMPSQVALQIGARGTGLAGAAGPPNTAGCVSQLTTVTGYSTGGITQNCVRPALRIWSALIAWRDM